MIALRLRYADNYILTTLLSAMFLYGSAAGASKCSGLVAYALSHPLLTGLGEYAFAIYLWATPVACVMTVYMTHNDGLAMNAANIFYEHTNATTRPIAANNSAILGPINETIVGKADVATFGAFLLMIHFWGVAYTDLFEASVFGGGGGCIGRLLHGRTEAPSKKL